MRAGIIAGCICSISFGACVRIEGDRVTAKHLAKAAPAFAAVPGDAVIGFAPAPGLQRNFSAGELSRIAHRLGAVEEVVEGICVERASEVLTEERLLTAIRSALPRTGFQIEILDFSRYPVPAGELEFTLAGLPRPPAAAPDAPVIWRGRVKYGDRRTVTVWASVRISSEGSWIEAALPIAANEEIRASQLILRSGRMYGLDAGVIRDPNELIGRRLAHSVRAGQRITADMIGARREVEAGDLVQASVVSGAAALMFEARAESGGRTGQRVFVKMPDTGRRISAQVIAKGKVQLDVDKKDVAAAGGSADRVGGDDARPVRREKR
ncbi:MAG TPA: flagellar basal body P-ring formation chaperone FlgA [Bryobacteraceae bacterium]|jgi:flagella basal body P-ring formation protein FlgA|nr:flagellar basal body P-ring formation chaperone FlgA [Bryobacteraceae bacterium]